MRPRPAAQGAPGLFLDEVLPLLTLRTFSAAGAQASAGGIVGALAFLSPSALACGDSHGLITVLDLHSRRPRFCLSLSSGKATNGDRDAYSASCSFSSGSRSSSSSCCSSSSSRSPAASSCPSPVLLVQGVGRRSAALDSFQSRGGEDCLTSSADSGGGETQVVPRGHGRFECLFPWLLSQHRSSVVTAWDLETSQPTCGLRTGAYSFCKLAVLDGSLAALDGDAQGQNPKTSRTTDELGQRTTESAAWGGDASRKEIPEKTTPLPSSAEASSRSSPSGNPCSPPCTPDGLPLLACPLADSEAFGIYDLRVRCHASRISQPAISLKCHFSSSSPFGYSGAPRGSSEEGGWGMVQGLAGVSKLGPTPHVAAAYELPCVALWDIRQPRCPLSEVPLPPSSPPSSLAVFRNRLWVGCFDGDLTVLDIRRDGTFKLPPRDYIQLFGEKTPSDPSCSSSARTPCLPHPEGDLSQTRLLLSTAFRPDGAIVAVGASDGGFRLFETKTGRCLGTLSPQDAVSAGSEAAGGCMAWCGSTGVLATGGGRGRIALWSPYIETYGGKKNLEG